MSSAQPPSDQQRFQPHASREMAEMFDDVSGRYDLLNAVMTLGRDAGWRAAMWREVPDDAAVVLDLCTGSGASLPGLRQPGRLVIGADVSLRMLELARDEHGRAGWAPRLVCTDAFHLPLRDASVDCVTIAFGMRNLRPNDGALAEILRVLKPGGTLLTLEATAPRAGLLAPLHRFHLTHVVRWLGRLSPDPSAYAYLGRSILDFGTGDEFERAMRALGFAIEGRRGFMFGATALWTATAVGEAAPAAAPGALQSAREPMRGGGRMPTRAARRETEWRRWTALQLTVSVGILAFLTYAAWTFRTLRSGIPLDPWQRQAMEMLLLVGMAGFVVRSVILAFRLAGPPPRL